VTGHEQSARSEHAFRFAVECESAPRRRCHALAQRRREAPVHRRRARAAPRGFTTRTESGARGVTGHGELARCERALRVGVECENAPRRRCYARAQRRLHASGRRRRARGAPRSPATGTGVGRTRHGPARKTGEMLTRVSLRCRMRECAAPATRLPRAGEKHRAPAKSTSGAGRVISTRARESGGRGVTTRKIAAARKTHGGGRPPKPTRCPRCGYLCTSTRSCRFFVDATWVDDSEQHSEGDLEESNGIRGHNSAVVVGPDGRDLPKPKPEQGGGAASAAGRSVAPTSASHCTLHKTGEECAHPRQKKPSCEGLKRAPVRIYLSSLLAV
jgi:hypothetical protein